MQTIEQPTHRIEDARAPLWFGSGPATWGDVVRTVQPDQARDAAAMVAAADLDWTVEQHPLEALVPRENEPLRVSVPRHVANVRSDTGAVLGVVGEGYEPLQNRQAFAFCDAITGSGRAHWIGAGATRGGARVHALMRLAREIRIGGAEGEEVLPLLCFRNGHDGGLQFGTRTRPSGRDDTARSRGPRLSSGRDRGFRHRRGQPLARAVVRRVARRVGEDRDVLGASA